MAASLQLGGIWAAGHATAQLAWCNADLFSLVSGGQHPTQGFRGTPHVVKDSCS